MSDGFPMKRVPQDFIQAVPIQDACNDRFEADLIERFLISYCVSVRETISIVQDLSTMLKLGYDPDVIIKQLDQLAGTLSTYDDAFRHSMKNITYVDEIL